MKGVRRRRHLLRHAPSAARGLGSALLSRSLVPHTTWMRLVMNPGAATLVTILVGPVVAAVGCGPRLRSRTKVACTPGDSDDAAAPPGTTAPRAITGPGVASRFDPDGRCSRADGALGLLQPLHQPLQRRAAGGPGDGVRLLGLGLLLLAGGRPGEALELVTGPPGVRISCGPRKQRWRRSESDEDPPAMEFSSCELPCS